MTSTFNWDDISINSDNPETFFGKRHIKHERVYYDLLSSQPVLNKIYNKPKENNKENKPIGRNAIQDSDIDKLNKKCENQLKISVKSNRLDDRNVNTNTKTINSKKMLPPPVRPKAYDYADIYKKRKEIKANEAKQNVMQPQVFKSKPLPTFYRSTKSSTHAKPKNATIPITPMVLKRSANNKKVAAQTKN